MYDVGPMSGRHIGRALHTQAGHRGDRAFLLSNDSSLTYQETWERTTRIASGLQSLGVGPGDVVAMVMQNSIDCAVAAFAVNTVGATWSAINTSFEGAWLRNSLGVLSGAKALIVDPSTIGQVEACDPPTFPAVILAGGQRRGGSGAMPVLPLSDLEQSPPLAEPVEVSPFDAASIMWTSGTTGAPKGILQSHSTWLASSDLICRGRDVRPDDVFYCCVPMFNSGAWVLCIYSALVSGTSVAIDESFSVRRFWDQCRRFGATQILTIGAMHMFLWQEPERPDDADNPVRVGALLPMPHELVKPFASRFGLEFIWQGFGQSEVMPWSMTEQGRTFKPGSAGVPRPDLEVSLLNDMDEPVPTGEVGEVCIRPREPGIVFSGYYRNPEATLEAYRNLWYHSGDLGRFDDDGELYFVDRKADFMRFKGRNISSFEVEGILAGHPDVVEAAAHGVPSELLDTEDEVKVVVVPRPGSTLSAEDVARYMNDHAPYYMVPRYVEFVEELPRTPTGKVQKYLLKQRGVTEGTWDRDQAGFSVRRH
jgi:carnitine-CoA ligase